MRAPQAAADPAPAPDVAGRRRASGRALLWPAIVVGLAAAIATALPFYLHARDARRTISGLRVAGVDLGGVLFGELDARLQPIEDAYLDQPMALSFGGARTVRTHRELGLSVDHDELLAELRRSGHSGDLLADLADRGRRLSSSLPVALDRQKALAALEDLKLQLDRPPVEARLDLEHRTVTDSQDGLLLDVYASVDAIERAAREQSGEAKLAGVVTPPRVTRDQLAELDISRVVGFWETGYGVTEIDRDYNLKVAADKLNGHVLLPHEIFSFNDVVGPRTQRQGYRVAPVILKGELVDGLAGGACQIASTLYAAAFFAGLDLVSSTPHSRPSHYIPMGLDATVVYPSVDLKLRNPYDFPIVIHYRVHQGKVQVELLGKRRPYKVLFQREILEETPYDTDSREDLDLPTGLQIVDQGGVYGFHIKKTRDIYQGSRLVKENTWDVKYPPTTEFIRIGTGDPSLPPPDKIPVVHQKPVPEVGNIAKIVRPERGQP